MIQQINPSGPSIRDWVDWLSFWFTVGGGALTVAGLAFTYREANTAKKRAESAAGSADAAKRAAEAAVETVSERVTIRDLTQIRSALQLALLALESRREEIALHHLRHAREKLNELRARRGFQARAEEVQSVVFELASMQETVEAHVYHGGSADELSLTTISGLLSRHMDMMSGWGEELRFSTGNGQ